MEIFAEIESNGIYLSGDLLKIKVTFRNVRKVGGEAGLDADDVNNSFKVEHLAWASAQIQCICQLANFSAPSRYEKPMFSRQHF
jgi:hypothetical protein